MTNAPGGSLVTKYVHTIQSKVNVKVKMNVIVYDKVNVKVKIKSGDVGVLRMFKYNIYPSIKAL